MNNKTFFFTLLFVIFFELFFLNPIFSKEKSYRVQDIVKFIEIIEEAQDKIGIKIINFDFKRTNGKISGFIEIMIPDEKEDKFNTFLKNNGINIQIVDGRKTKIYVYESYYTPIPRDFFSAFKYSLITLITSKNFYLLIILSIIFYTLILPNLLKF